MPGAGCMSQPTCAHRQHRAEQLTWLREQVGFFEIVALPLFTGYTQLVPDAKPLLDAVMSNYQHWHAGARE